MSTPPPDTLIGSPRRRAAIWAFPPLAVLASDSVGSALTAAGSARWHLARAAVVAGALFITFRTAAWPPHSRMARLHTMLGRTGAALAVAVSVAAVVAGVLATLGG
jgi:hypothetical protein